MMNNKRPLSPSSTRQDLTTELSSAPITSQPVPSTSRNRSSTSKKEEKLRNKSAESKLYDSKVSECLARETLSSMGLVVNIGLFGLEKGLKSTYDLESCSPLLPFTTLVSILKGGSFGKNARVVPFLIDQEPYKEMLEEVLALEELNSTTLNLSSLYGETKPTENITKLIEACQYVSRDIILGLINEIASYKVDNGFALIQSPGKIPDITKKAEIDAVEIALKKGQHDRVMILSWDAVHSKQLQDRFYDRPDVLVVSLHRSGLTHLPSTGLFSEIGIEAGIARNVNIPLPNNDFDNGSLFYAFQHVVMPIATEFQPTLVLISTSFDASCGDELGTARVSPDVYAHMTYSLRTLAGGKIAVCLDSDNSVTSIENAIYAVASVLLGQSPPRSNISLLPTRSGMKVVADLIKVLAPHWQCLKFLSLKTN